MPLTEHMIDTKLGRLHVEVDGEGPAAVLWHSLFVDSRSWSRLRGLLREDRRLVLIDAPDTGKVAPRQQISISTTAPRRRPKYSRRWACRSPPTGWVTRGEATSG